MTSVRKLEAMPLASAASTSFTGSLSLDPSAPSSPPEALDSSTHAFELPVDGPLLWTRRVERRNGSSMKYDKYLVTGCTLALALELLYAGDGFNLQIARS